MLLSVRALVATTVLLAAVPALALHPHHPTKSAHATTRQTHHSSSHSTRSSHVARITHHGRATTVHHGRANTAHHGRATVAHHAEAHVAMDSTRATQIQTALIKQGYLTGEPTGNWDASSIAAMQKLQSDNGWQTKIMPDSRALIKLGLGPQGSVQ
jgi:hypothetical protein